MKTTSFSTLALAMAGFVLLGIGCTDSTLAPDTQTQTGQLKVPAAFADQTNRFAFDFAKRVSQKEGTATNTFVSPLSLHMALGMILNGANGQTAQEIQKTLNLDAQTLSEANATYQNLMENLPTVDPKVTLALANSVWSRNTFPVEPSFQALLKQSFRAEIQAEDFTSPATVGKINGWASQKTNDRIPKVIDQISDQDVLFLMNALYFKGDWKTEFKPGQTIDAPFTLTSGGQRTVRMMRLNTTLRRAFKPTYTAFELPYGAGNYAMTVLLPSQNTSADALIQSLNGASWTSLQSELTSGTIDIGLPKFTLSYEIKLNDVLTAMGMPTAFTDRADFTKINANGGLLLSFVKQNTFVAVDEKGTEAAAVTTGGISVTSAPLSYLCDRPFVFVIHEKTSGTVLFVGKIADPTQTAP
ncbi:serpin family protein [Spirosoma sordidisoli]|uniref:Serpin family protein n=1 Tax=Spirosoma sordidisoli TaxID=2502893 RepID=A0A4Q2ULB6_9BACT|nr:serpin family protein [Spirosoma sordidisoli]RYC68295.1 serpin family protein [Spirosoma sordidisoli]